LLAPPVALYSTGSLLFRILCQFDQDALGAAAIDDSFSGPGVGVNGAQEMDADARQSFDFSIDGL